MVKQTSTMHALSIKQPWAALVVAGLKTIEIRRWATARRGRILIHAARVPDDRPKVRDQVPRELQELAQLRGGIIGAVDLADCRPYRDLPAFVADQALHFNEPSWFEPPLLYGFVFERPEIVPFQVQSGWFRFFKVEWPTPVAR